MNNFVFESNHKPILANNTRKANHFSARQTDGRTVFAKACSLFLNMLTDMRQLLYPCYIDTISEASTNLQNEQSASISDITASHPLVPVEHSQ